MKSPSLTGRGGTLHPSTGPSVHMDRGASPPVSDFRPLVVLVFPVVFVLLLLLQGFCCVRILQVLRESGPGEGSRSQSDPAKKKAFITVLVIQVMMVMMVMTVLAVPLRGRLSRHVYLCQLFPAALSFSVFGSFIQPIMFLLRRRQ